MVISLLALLALPLHHYILSYEGEYMVISPLALLALPLHHYTLPCKECIWSLAL